MKFKFKVGIYNPSYCTVEASSLKDARIEAYIEMDRRYKGKGKEPPVGWDLHLISVDSFSVESYLDKVLERISIEHDGLLIGVKDKNGRSIRTGDTMIFDEEEWGGPDNEFVVYFKDGELQINGTVKDLSEFCEVVEMI